MGGGGFEVVQNIELSVSGSAELLLLQGSRTHVSPELLKTHTNHAQTGLEPQLEMSSV